MGSSIVGRAAAAQGPTALGRRSGLRLGAWVFAPGRGATLAAALLLPLFVSLGFWQVHRAAEKRAIEQTAVARLALPAVDLGRDARDWRDPALGWRAATVRGHWQARQILLDNQVSRGEAGYLVFSPLRIDGGPRAVLVERGWIAVGPGRAVLPKLDIAAAAANLHGIIAPPPAPPFASRNDVEALDGGAALRVQSVDLANLSLRLDRELLPFILRLDPTEPAALRRDRLLPALRAERHVAYALQWFLFAALVCGYWLGAGLSRR
jgi:surfeit locus 1 family protein